jgi:hypothetical protein
MKRFEVIVRTKVDGAICIRTAEAIAQTSIDAMCSVVRALGIDGPISSSVKLAKPTAIGKVVAA